MSEIGVKTSYEKPDFDFDKGFKIVCTLPYEWSHYYAPLFRLSIFIADNRTLWSIGFSNLAGFGYNFNPYTKELFRPIKPNRKHKELESLLKSL